MSDSMFRAIVGCLRTVPPAVQATFNPDATSSRYVLSSGNRVVTSSSTASSIAVLQGYKDTGKYWIEVALSGSANVENSMLGLADISANIDKTPDADTHSLGIYSSNTSGAYSLAYNANYGPYATSKPFNGTGAIMCGLYDNDNRQFFLYVRPVLLPGAWITADPNVSPLGGVPYFVTGPIAPMFSTYYSSIAATLRDPSAFTETGVCPAGTTMGWPTY